MSKYKERGPYHFIEYADANTPYHAHVRDLAERIAPIAQELEARDGCLRVHEVGCGEGLILHVLKCEINRIHIASGNDIDYEAVRMGKLLVPYAKICLEHDAPRRWSEEPLDIVLFCDSLEHIAEWQQHLRWARERASVVVTAVPSIDDRHAVNEFVPSDFDKIFSEWDLRHRRTRDYRHLSIYVRR